MKRYLIGAVHLTFEAGAVYAAKLNKQQKRQKGAPRKESERASTK